MSATAALISCPVCSHTGVFESIQTLRDRLIFVSTNKILCPICQEEVAGLDKLTIHLFTHVKILSTKECNNTQVSKIQEPKCEKNIGCATPVLKKPLAKNKTPSSAPGTPMKYVKICPKLPVISISAIPVIDAIKSDSVSGNSDHTCLPRVKTEPLTQRNTVCNICGLQFVDEKVLKLHRCIIHNLDADNPQNITNYQCHLCPKNFKMKGSLMVHLRVAHYGFLTGNYSSSVNKYEKEDHQVKVTEQSSDNTILAVGRNDNKQWQCDVCRKSFTTKYFLKKHKRLHTGETPYSCTQCNKTFTFQQSYHKHLLYHNDEKPHICNYCGRAFKELSTLHNHQRIHTGEKPFACETCGKCFRQRVSYLVHRRIHTGVMPYKCTACEKYFRYKVSQRTHKCPAKPPGTVVRRTGELVEKLKKKYANMEESSAQQNQITVKTMFSEVSEDNAKLVLTGAKLSLEDMESDNFNLIADSYETNNYPTHAAVASSSQVTINSNQLESKGADTMDSNLEALINDISVNSEMDKSIPSPSEILKNLHLSKDEDLANLCQDNDDTKNFLLYKDFESFM